MIKNNTVIVIDLGNYKKEFQEKVPFKAIVTDMMTNEVWIKSLATGKTYEIYYNQILEGLDIDGIEKLLDISKVGDYR